MVVDTRNPAGVRVDSAYLAFTLTSLFYPSQHYITYLTSCM
jgi:hypothetical protein